MANENDADDQAPNAHLMLLGTFHFQDRGLDVYKPQFDVDILSAQRQQEVSDVLDRLARFQPTKIAVERRLDWQAELDQTYRAYLQDGSLPSGDEIHQLGFQLAKRCGHPTVYAVDASGRYYTPPVDLDIHASGRTTKELQQFLEEQLQFAPFDELVSYAQAHGQDELISKWLTKIQRAGEQGDESKTQQTLRETLAAANREANIWQSHGPYLTGPFKVGEGHEYPGVDYVTAWYSRNLRIFANLQRLTTLGDRILLIIGAGHLPILRHCALTCPEYHLVEVHDYFARQESGA